MDVPANFKFDVRIRARLLAKGKLSEAEVAKHLEALADAQPQSDMIDLAQPALTSPEERERMTPVSTRASAVVPRQLAAVERAPLSIPPAATPVDEAWDDDDEDDDLDDEDEDEDDEDGDKVEAKAEAKAETKAEKTEEKPKPVSSPAAAEKKEDVGEEE